MLAMASMFTAATLSSHGLARTHAGMWGVCSIW
jgi:hypothetical protein